MSESVRDQIERLRLMATSDKWDLSPNDRAAIAMAVEALDGAGLSIHDHCTTCGCAGRKRRTP